MSIVQNEYYQQLLNLMTTSSGSLKVASTFHKQMQQINALLRNDRTGLVGSILDFMIQSGTVDVNFNASNKNLTKLFSEWKQNVNADLNLDIPRGLRGFTEQYLRERWKSSFIVVNLRWHKVDGFWMPSRIYLMDGASVHVKNDKRLLNGNAYYLGKPDSEGSVPLRNTKDSTFIVRKPFNSWYDEYPIPYLVKKGALYHALFKSMILERQGEIIQTAFPYQLLLKVGTQDAIKKGMGPTQADLDNIKSKFQNQKKNYDEHTLDRGLIGAFAGDVNMEEMMPDYLKALNEGILKSTDKNLLSALGMVELKGFSSNREEALLNPKVLVEEVEDAVKDYVELLKEIVIQIKDKNSGKYTVNEHVEVQPGIIKSFLTDDMRGLIRSWYDRGIVGQKSALEATTGYNYETQIKEREIEDKKGYDKVLYPRVIQNLEQNPDEDVSDDKKKGTPEAKNYKNALAEKCIDKEMKTIRDIPKEIKADLSNKEQQTFKKAFNECFVKATNLKYDDKLREKASLEYAWKMSQK